MVLQFLPCAAINLLPQLSKAAGHMGGVAVQDWRVASFDPPWMVQDDHLTGKKKVTSAQRDE